MSRLLVDNPKGYVINFLGYQNKKELNVALEIFLAEISLSPDYYTFVMLSIDESKLKEVMTMQLNEYRNAGHEKNFDCKGILKVIYYFHFLQWVRNVQSIKEEELFWFAFSKILAREIIESNYKKSSLQSRVAKGLFERSILLNNMFLENECFIAPLKNDLSNQDIFYNKMLGAMTLQHRELYELEVERLKSHSEYSLYEKFEDVLDSTYQLLFDTQSILL